MAFLAVSVPAVCAAVEPVPTTEADFGALDFDQLAKIRVTTVSRSESTLQRSPAAVFVITPDMIRRSGATAVPELFRMVPGLHVARIDGNKWAVASRGFNSRFAKNLLVQIDGRSVYSPQTAGVFWDGVDLPLADIERIEVIRGPGASVWGANAVNGIINIITKPAAETQGGYLTLGGGTEERGFGTFRYGGRLADDLAFRVYAKGFDREKQYSPEGDAHDAWQGGSGGLRLDWTPNARDTLILDTGFGRSETGTKDRFANRIGPNFAPNVPETDTTDTGHVRGLWEHREGADSGWKLQAFWDRWERTDTFHYRDTLFDTFDLDFQHEMALGKRNRFVWGAGGRYVDADLKNSQPDGNFTLDWIDNESTMEKFSAFLQDEIALVPGNLALTLGAKGEYNNFTEFEFQPSGRLLWTPDERQSLWASVSRAVRTPSFTENEARFTVPAANPQAPPVARVVANRGLKPEEVVAYELGYRVQATDKLTLDTAVFYNVHDELRANRVNPALAGELPPPLKVASQFDNGMEGDVYGAEVSATWRVTDSWRLVSAYTYLNIELHRDADLPASAEAAEGQDPEHQVYLQSSWTLPRGIEVDLIGRFVDRLSGFNPSGIPGVNDEVPSYVAVDARISGPLAKNVRLDVVGQNLFDDHHPELGTNPFIRSPLVEIERSVYAAVTWTF